MRIMFGYACEMDDTDANDTTQHLLLELPHNTSPNS